MTILADQIIDDLRFDLDRREERIREVVSACLEERPTPRSEAHVVASYFFALRSTTLDQLGGELAYHATSGIRRPPPGSLLAGCTGEVLGIDAFDASRRTGILHMGFPLKMLLHPDGHVTSVDILHSAASAIVFDVYECQDARLVGLELPPSLLATFPGPAYGPDGIRRLVNFPFDQPAFGTILKPTAGLTPAEVETLASEAASCPLFLFIKEDENLYPDLPYSPVVERTRRAVKAVESARAARGGAGVMFAPNITAAPHELGAIVSAVVDAGATAVMLSETFAGGAVRMVREATKTMAAPPAIYGHNAGIGTRTRAIWREVIDLLARLDGVDFRQTAPVLSSTPFLRPYGKEWAASEEILTRDLPGIAPTMIARAGGLDQGNIILNLEDAEARGLNESVLYLAGSAINSLKGSDGDRDPHLGATAMFEALEVHRSGELEGLPADDHLPSLRRIAKRDQLSALEAALTQRYQAAPA